MLTRRQVLQGGAAACTGAIIGGFPAVAGAAGISQAIANLRAKFPPPYSDILDGGQFAWLYAWRRSLAVPNPLAVRASGGAYVDACIGYVRRADFVSLAAYVAQHNYNDASFEAELSRACASRCYQMAGVVAQCVNALGGLSGPPSASAPYLSSGRIYTTSEKQPEPWYRPWYEMVRYDPSVLAGQVGLVRGCLAAGYMVKAGVCSGITADKSLADPDHYVLIIGVDGDHFVAWDPDAAVSCRPAPAYCTLTHWKPADPRHHRFGTSRSDDEFKCDGDGNFKLGGDITTDAALSADGSVPYTGKNHRYQVTLLERV